LLANFSRLFVGQEAKQKLNYTDDYQLSLAAKNLEKVLKRVLTQPVLKNEIFEWLNLFVPEFKNVEVVANPFSGEETLLWYEHYAEKPFTKDLISDGTYNILAMLTAVYQSDDKPQFLCIEEPENGLHPQVAGELIDFFRIMCEERGHHIWLNTHSQSMIARLKPEEMIVVEKKQGKTQTTQYQGRDFHGLRMDEALLMNVLGGGLPW
jgi:predicted ATPase